MASAPSLTSASPLSINVRLYSMFIKFRYINLLFSVLGQLHLAIEAHGDIINVHGAYMKLDN